MYVYVIFLLTLSSSLTSYFYVLLYLFLAISFVLALKLFVYYSLIAANIILVYIFGFVVISINFVSSLMSFGLLTLSFYLYLFLSVYYSFLLVLFLIELFSSFFNSLTLTNRLSINIFVGSLLINLLSLLSSAFGCLILAVFFIYESLNLLFQSFIFLLLSFFYLSRYFPLCPHSTCFPICFCLSRLQSRYGRIFHSGRRLFQFMVPLYSCFCPSFTSPLLTLFYVCAIFSLFSTISSLFGNL
jgi:hypothetical protein